jgi:hypothetical protein
MKKSLAWLRAFNLTALFIAATNVLADEPIETLLDPLDPAYLLWLLGRIGIPGG